METLLDFAYWIGWFISIMLGFAAIHYTRERNTTESLGVRHQSEIMILFCIAASLGIALILAAPYLFTEFSF